MKRNLCLLLFLSLFGSVFGQKHWVGFDAGYNHTKASLLEGSSLTFMKPGHKFAIGFHYNYDISNKMFLRIDLQYSQRYFDNWGARLFGQDGKPYGFTDTANYQIYDESQVIYRYHYLHLPIRFGGSWGNKVQYVLSVSAAPGLLVYSESQLTIEYLDTMVNERNNSTANTTKFDITVGIENGMRIEFKEHYRFLLSFNIFSSVLQTVNPVGIRDIDYNNKRVLFYGIQLMAGFQFGIKPKGIAKYNW